MTEQSGAGDELLESRLGYRFHRRKLLVQALTHSSAAGNAQPEGPAGERAEAEEGNNERLEFLGDAVLGLLASEHLLGAFRAWSEGQLSKSRARIVNAQSLEQAARRLYLGEHLRLGRGEEKTGGRDKPALLADAFEAIIAAVYLDGGLDAAREVLRRTLLDEAIVERGELIAESDKKSALQEYLQGLGQPPAEYRIAGESGPDHQKLFVVGVWCAGELLASGEGRTKKEAEQRAARSALEHLGQS